MDGQGHVTPDGAGFRCVTRRDSHTGRETHPGEARARIQFRDPPRRRWQLGLMNPRAAPDLQGTGGKHFDTRNARGPLRPALHVHHHRPNKWRRRGDFHRDDKIRSNHVIESRVTAQVSSATASALYLSKHNNKLHVCSGNGTLVPPGFRTTAAVERPTTLRELKKIVAHLMLGHRHKSPPGQARHRWGHCVLTPFIGGLDPHRGVDGNDVPICTEWSDLRAHDIVPSSPLDLLLSPIVSAHFP